MKKNVASQKVCIQMTNATTGAEFTGTVTVYVLGDAGTQAIGSVSSGICTHEGHGVHSYAPATAETNYDNVVFTFVGTGAVTSSVQMYPDDLNLETDSDLGRAITKDEALKLILAVAAGDWVIDPATGDYTIKSRDASVNRITATKTTTARTTTAVNVT